MPKPFFPDVTIAWIFCLVLIALVIIAAISDTRKALIPNKLTVTTLAIGMIFNLIRGAWQGQQGGPLWVLETGTWWMGALDGFLFGLAGFALALAMLFLFYLFGMIGGGDVKLFAAIGGWMGWLYVLYIWFVSIPLLFIWTFLALVRGGFKRRALIGNKPGSQAQKTPGPAGQTRKGKIKLTYSAPIAIATAIVLMWVFRVELQLSAAKPMQRGDEQGVVHAP